MKHFHGVYTAIVTPFAGEAIDWEALDRLIEFQIGAGIDGLIVCGTTGESPTLLVEEKKKLFEHAKKKINGRCDFIAATGTNNTQASVALSQFASELGADGLLVVTPYYNKPSQKGLIAHFTAIANAVNVPLMLYNVPGRTITEIEVETAVELARHERITSIKEASGDMGYTKRLLSRLSEEGLSLDVLSGDDPTFLELLEAGGHGVVSVTSNVLPGAMRELFTSRSKSLDEKLKPLFRDLFIEPNPVPAKAVLAHLGVCREDVRLPLVSLDESARKIIISTFEAAR